MCRYETRRTCIMGMCGYGVRMKKRRNRQEQWKRWPTCWLCALIEWKGFSWPNILERIYIYVWWGQMVLGLGLTSDRAVHVVYIREEYERGWVEECYVCRGRNACCAIWIHFIWCWPMAKRGPSSSFVHERIKSSARAQSGSDTITNVRLVGHDGAAEIYILFAYLIWR